ncbi:MAG TPA: cation-translocating P-type ATPase, partial [Fimbriiglobus sp.]
LAYGMRKMAATNTLVRRLHAVETVGATTVICTDKTGTLTTNEMRVTAARLPTDAAGMWLVAEAVSANSTANLSRIPGEPIGTVGNPTEAALLLWLDGKGIDYAPIRSGFRVSQQWTFTTERKLMATRGDSPVLGGPVLHVKGAPEVILDRCSRVVTEGGAEPISCHLAEIRSELAEAQSRGQRTLGLAYQEAPPVGELDASAVGLTWLGFVTVDDPIRTDVPEAIAVCRAAGIQVKIVTGDSPGTAAEVARQVGLDVSAERHLTGPEFAKLSDSDAGDAAIGLTVLSRARPADKLRLVSLLKKRGEVVAVTGDGVNDGPALNYADVGLAMAKTGTAVAKEASDVLLLDDSFASIVTAVRWGRGLYENVQRFLLFQLTINVAALGLVFLGPFVGVKLTLTVMQMLWVNLIMDTFAALALATEPPHANVLARSPRKAGAFIVTGPMSVVLFSSAALFLAGSIVFVFVLKSAGLDPDADGPTRGGTLLFTAFVLLQFWNLFNSRAWGRGGSALGGLGANPWFLGIAAAVLGGQVLIVQFGGAVFRTVPLSLADWVRLIGLTALVLVVGEAVRFTIGLRRRNGASPSLSSSVPAN